MPAKSKQVAKGSQGKKTPKSDKKRKCKRCGTTRGLIRRYHLGICRRCFREVAESMGFKKFGG